MLASGPSWRKRHCGAGSPGPQVGGAAISCPQRALCPQLTFLCASVSPSEKGMISPKPPSLDENWPATDYLYVQRNQTVSCLHSFARQVFDESLATCQAMWCATPPRKIGGGSGGREHEVRPRGRTEAQSYGPPRKKRRPGPSRKAGFKPLWKRREYKQND